MKLGNRAFTINELIVVVAIIGLISAVVVASISSVRSKARDAQVRSDKQLLILALVRAREADPNYLYPGSGNPVGTYRCLKPVFSLTCWRNTLNSGSAIYTTIQPYLPNGIVPTPPGTRSGQYRHDAYVFTANAIPTAGYPQGAYLIWWQEKPIPNNECNGWNAGQLDTGIYYCYEQLPR